MDFVDVGYAYLVPVLIFVILFSAKSKSVQYYKNVLATLNVSLLFFVAFSCKEYYNLYKLAKAFGFNVSVGGLLKLFSTNISFVIRNAVVFLVPLLFLIKKLSANLILSAIMVILLWWDIMYGVVTHLDYHFPGSGYEPFLVPVLRYICLQISLFAALWLTKRLPYSLY